MNTVNIEQTCRICLRQSKRLKPLFTERNSFADRINDCFNFDFKVCSIQKKYKSVSSWIRC